MSIDRSAIGREFPAVSLLITRSRLRDFARSTGQDDLVYLNIDEAKGAGHRDLPVPPTFLFGIELESPDPFAYLADLGVDLRAVLHGEQHYEYYQMSYAGDELTAASRIAEVYAKKSMEFVVRETVVTNHEDQRVANLQSVLIVRDMPGRDQR